MWFLSGDCLGRFTTQKTPYCIKFNPDEDKQHLFVVGCSDKKIYTVRCLVLSPSFKLSPFLLPPFISSVLFSSVFQFDTTNGEIVQEYDRHLGAVNTVTFVDENRRFVTTSDDKSIRVWEW